MISLKRKISIRKLNFIWSTKVTETYFQPFWKEVNKIAIKDSESNWNNVKNNWKGIKCLIIKNIHHITCTKNIFTWWNTITNPHDIAYIFNNYLLLLQKRQNRMLSFHTNTSQIFWKIHVGIHSLYSLQTVLK